jgi:hypothetical protein
VDFDLILTVVSASVAGVSAIAGAISSTLAVVRLARDKARLTSLDADGDLEKADLTTLGNLLTVKLGGTSLASYARNDRVRKDFQRTFDQVREFLNREEQDDLEVRHESAVDPNDEVVDANVLRDAVDAMEQGKTWNALAIARRELELRLLALMDVERAAARRGARQLLEMALRREVVEPEWRSRLDHAIAMSNRAIHGEEVSDAVAEESLNLIRWFLSEHPAEVPATT